MLTLYRRVTGGMTQWLLMSILNFVGPLIRIVGGFMSVGGLIVFLLCLAADVPHTINGGKTITFVMLGVGLLGSAILAWYEVVTSRLFLDLLYPEDDARDKPWWIVLRDGFLLVGLYGAMSVAAYYFHGLRNFVEAMGVGFAWFVGIGVLLNLAHIAYERGDEALEAFRESRSRRRGSDHKKVASNDDVEGDNILIFRNRAGK